MRSEFEANYNFWFNTNNIEKEELLFVVHGLEPRYAENYLRILRAEKELRISQQEVENYIEQTERLSKSFERTSGLFAFKYRKFLEERNIKIRERRRICKSLYISYKEKEFKKSYSSFLEDKKFLNPISIDEDFFDDIWKEGKLNSVFIFLKRLYNNGCLFPICLEKYLQENKSEILVYEKNLGWVKKYTGYWCDMNHWTLKETLQLCFGYIPDEEYKFKYLYYSKKLLTNLKYCRVKDGGICGCNTQDCSVYIKKLKTFKLIEEHIQRYYPLGRRKYVDSFTRFNPRKIMKFLLETTDLEPPKILLDILFNEDRTNIKDINKKVINKKIKVERNIKININKPKFTALNSIIFDAFKKLYEKDGCAPATQDVWKRMWDYQGKDKVVLYINGQISIKWRVPTTGKIEEPTRRTFNNFVSKLRKMFREYLDGQ